MRRWVGVLALGAAIGVVGVAGARTPQEDLVAVDKAIADLAKLRELVQAQQAKAREALVQIRRQQAALAEAAEQLEKALRQASIAYRSSERAPDELPTIRTTPVVTPAPAVKEAATPRSPTRGNIVLHMPAQGWRITAGSFQVDSDGNVVLAPFTGALRTDRSERRYTAARAVLRLDQGVRDVASLSERKVLSVQFTGEVKVRNDQGYLLDAERLDVTFAETAPTMTAQGKVHFQTGDLPVGAFCVRADRLLLADTLWFAGSVTVQTGEAHGQGDRGRYDSAKNCLYLESDAKATLQHKGKAYEGRRLVLDLGKGQILNEE